MEGHPQNPRNPRKYFKMEDIATASRFFNAKENTNNQISIILGCKPRAVSSLKSRMAVTSNEEVKYEHTSPIKEEGKS